VLLASVLDDDHLRLLRGGSLLDADGFFLDDVLESDDARLLCEDRRAVGVPLDEN